MNRGPHFLFCTGPQELIVAPSMTLLKLALNASLTCETPSLLIHNVGPKVQASWLGPQTLPHLARGNFLLPFHSSTLTILLGHLEILVAS